MDSTPPISMPNILMFNLVKMANEQRECHCTKIKNARRNIKRMLIVDRHRIAKKAMDDCNIGTIIDIHVLDRNNKQSC